MISDFSERELPLVAGSIYGKRAWAVRNGRLHSPLMRQIIWGPGEQTASCEEWDLSYDWRTGVSPFAVGYRSHKPVTHNFNYCSCGFYAFFDGRPNEHEWYGAVGIIEGYGQTIIGSKGFRCEKARIVAIAPAPITTRFMGVRIGGYSRFTPRALKKNYPDVQVFKSAEKMYAAIPVTRAEDVEGLA